MRALTLCLLVSVFGMALSGHAFAQDSRSFQIGDVLSIQLPGEPAFDKPFPIDRDGKITLPEAGMVRIAGLTRDDAQEVVRAALAVVYRNMERLEVRLKESRVPVSVLGFVKNPGMVDLPADATVQMALNAAGGLAQGAQMDKLQVRRGETVLTFDYKKYLDTGDIGILPPLRPLDTLFVPASPLIGNVQVEFDARTLTAAGDGGDEELSIKVFGEVHRPGIYALKPGMSVVDMLMRAGGVTRYAGVEQIRVITKGQPRPFNLQEYLDSGKAQLLPVLGKGDVIFVPQASEQIKAGARTVYVMGEVFKPGAYETKEGAGFLDILATAGGPTRFAEVRQLRILKANGTVEPFDLQTFTENGGRVRLPEIKAGDAILVPEKTDMTEKSWLKVAPNRAIKIIGSVQRPGRYEWSDEMSLLDLLGHAGGPKEDADTAHVQVLSAKDGKTVQSREFNLKEFLEKGGAIESLPQLVAGDTIVLPELPKDNGDNRSLWVRQSSDHSIYIMGQIGAPGRYAFTPDMSLLDILSAAQGPTANADLANVRITHRKEDKTRVTPVNLALYFETGDERLLPKVKPEDVIFLPERNRAWTEKPKETTVRVLGAVGKPGRYAFDDTMTILDLLAEAGGPTGSALQDQIVVVNLTTEGPKARSFDLVDFAKSGDFRNLPLLRSGDTVYVPGIEQSAWKMFSDGMRDAVSMLSLVRLATGM